MNWNFIGIGISYGNSTWITMFWQPMFSINIATTLLFMSNFHHGPNCVVCNEPVTVQHFRIECIQVFIQCNCFLFQIDLNFEKKNVVTICLSERYSFVLQYVFVVWLRQFQFYFLLDRISFWCGSTCTSRALLPEAGSWPSIFLSSRQG